MTDLIRSAFWMLCDAWRLQAFMLYRRTLIGDAFSQMCTGCENAAELLGSRSTYKVDKRRWWMDLVVQFILYATLDIVPLLIALLACLFQNTPGHWESFLSLWQQGVCIATFTHVLVFHIAWGISDVAAKRAAIIDAHRGGFLSSRQLDETALDERQHGFDAGDDSLEPSPRAGQASCDAASPHGSPRAQETRLGSASEGTARDFENLHDPPNICMLLTRIGASLPGWTVLTGIWVTILIIAFVIHYPVSFTIVFCSGLPLIKYCFIHLSERFQRYMDRRHADTEAAASNHANRDCRCIVFLSGRLRLWMRSISLHCGSSKRAMAAQLNIFFVMHLLYAIAFWFMPRYRGTLHRAHVIAAVYIALRRISLGWLQSYGCLLGFVEAFFYIFSTLVLGSSSMRTVLEIVVMAVLMQFTLARYDSYKIQTWHFFSVIFHVCLLVIVALSVFAVSTRELKIPPSPEIPQMDFNAFKFLTFLYPDTSRATTTTTTTKAPPWQSETVNSLCHVSFPLGKLRSDSSNRMLTFYDFALLSNLAYADPGDFEVGLEDLFPGWKKVFEHRGSINNGTRTYNDWTTYFELHDTENTTTVVVIRGSVEPLDWLQDMLIWMPSLVAQVFQIFGPSLTPLLQDVLFFVSKRLRSFQSGVYRQVLDHIQKIVEADPQRRYYITGHSLGGGLANLASLMVNEIAVTFSPPGVGKTARWLISNGPNMGQHEFTNAAPRLLYSVAPESDIVPLIDQQIGTMFRIPCAKNAIECHLMPQTQIQLWRECIGK
jgi:lipase ATG15